MKMIINLCALGAVVGGWICGSYIGDKTVECIKNIKKIRKEKEEKPTVESEA